MSNFFIVDYDIIIAEDLTEEALISYAYEKWVEDYEIRNEFDEPDDLGAALEYLEHYYHVIKGEYIV